MKCFTYISVAIPLPSTSMNLLNFVIALEID